MKIIFLSPLSTGRFTIVDDSDYEYLNQWKWHYNRGYATRNILVDGKQVKFRMHQILFPNTPAGYCMDHKNNDRLDNLRSNFRLCTLLQNTYNRKLSKNNTSGFNGVYQIKDRKYWYARIKVNQKIIFLGSFANKYLAAIRYNESAFQHFGEYARLNVLPPISEWNKS